MNMTKGQAYVLVEVGSGMLIMQPSQQMPLNVKTEKLVQADAHDLVSYLIRYLLARESGLNLVDAHKAALADAVVIRPGEQEAKAKPQ